MQSAKQSLKITICYHETLTTFGSKGSNKVLIYGN